MQISDRAIGFLVVAILLIWLAKLGVRIRFMPWKNNPPSTISHSCQLSESGTPIMCVKFGATMPTFGKPHPILPARALGHMPKYCAE
jgi:hypothetical protein